MGMRSRSLSELTGGFSSGEASLFARWGQPEFSSDIGGKVSVSVRGLLKVTKLVNGRVRS